MSQNLFFVTTTNCPFDLQKRVSPLHMWVFHGMIAEDSIEQTSEIDDDGRVTTSVVGALTLLRSGTFVPPAFMPLSDLIVSEQLRDKLSRIDGVEFTSVNFRKLVDLRMPPLGDTSWFDQVTYPPGPDVNLEIVDRPDLPALHDSVGNYYRITAPRIYLLCKRLADVERISISYGSYYGQPNERVLVSRSLLEQCPVVWDGPLVIRDDVFAILAPHLDRDYFSIAWK